MKTSTNQLLAGYIEGQGALAEVCQVRQWEARNGPGAAFYPGQLSQREQTRGTPPVRLCSDWTLLYQVLGEFDHIPLVFQALEMIHNIREAFNEILKESDWMDEETKAVAKQKVRCYFNIHFSFLCVDAWVVFHFVCLLLRLCNVR